MQDLSKTTSRRGFTLVEILITLSLVTLTLAMVLPSMTFLMQSNYVLGNTTGLTQQSRQFVDAFGIDLRSATNVAEADANKVVLTVTDPDYNEDTITYAYDADAGVVSRVAGSGGNSTLLSNVHGFQFAYSDSKNASTINNLEIKKIEVKMELKRSVLARDQELLHKSARFILRNRAAKEVL